MSENLKENVEKFLRLGSMMLPNLIGKRYDISEQGDKAVLNFFPEDSVSFDDAVIQLEDDAEMYIMANCESKGVPSINYAVGYSKPEPGFYNCINIVSDTSGKVASIVAKIYLSPEEMVSELLEDREFCESKYSTSCLKSEESVINTFQR